MSLETTDLIISKKKNVPNALKINLDINQNQNEDNNFDRQKWRPLLITYSLPSTALFFVINYFARYFRPIEQDYRLQIENQTQIYNYTGNGNGNNFSNCPLAFNSIKCLENWEKTWDNFFTSFFHSLLSFSSLFCLVILKNTKIRSKDSENSSKNSNIFLTTNPVNQKIPNLEIILSISIGYFIYDSFDMILKVPDQFWGIIFFHHLISFLALSWYAVQNYYKVYGAVGLIFEGHSVVYHVWNLMRTVPKSWKTSGDLSFCPFENQENSRYYSWSNENGTFFKIISILNYLTFIICRILPNALASYLLLEKRRRLNQWNFKNSSNQHVRHKNLQILQVLQIKIGYVANLILLLIFWGVNFELLYSLIRRDLQMEYGRFECGGLEDGITQTWYLEITVKSCEKVSKIRLKNNYISKFLILTLKN